MSFKNLAKLIHQASKERTPEEELLYLFQQTQTKLARDHKLNRKQSHYYNPSSLGGCMRKMAFKRTSAPPDGSPKIDPSMEAIQESGTDRHERIQTIITKMAETGHEVEWIDVEEYLSQYPVKGTEVVSNDGMETLLVNEILGLRFKCDGIIKWRGKYYILEIKTEISSKFMGRFSPEPKHISQASSYSVAIGIPDVIFMYEDRNVCSKKIFITHITDEMRDDHVIHKIETTNSYIERDTIPPVSADDKKDCRYCDWTDHCSKLLDGAMAYDYKEHRLRGEG